MPVKILVRTAKDYPDQDYMTMQSAKSIHRSVTKKHTDLKHYVSRFATTECGSGSDKVMEVDLTLSDESETMDDADAYQLMVMADRGLIPKLFCK